MKKECCRFKAAAIRNAAPATPWKVNLGEKWGEGRVAKKKDGGGKQARGGTQGKPMARKQTLCKRGLIELLWGEGGGEIHVTMARIVSEKVNAADDGV